jgi:hypothetical protein
MIVLLEQNVYQLCQEDDSIIKRAILKWDDEDQYIVFYEDEFGELSVEIMKEQDIESEYGEFPEEE